MPIRLLLTTALVFGALGCGEPAPPPVPANVKQTTPARVAQPTQARDSVSRATTTATSPTTFGPFTIEGGRFTAIATRFVNRDEGSAKNGTSRVEIRDSLQRVVYAERVMSDSDIASGSWNDFTVSPLEDASGRARALVLWSSFYPSAPNTGDSFSVVAARGDTLRRLFTLGHFGTADSMATDASPGAARLLPGDRIVSPRWMYFYEAKIPLRVSFDCVPGSGRCLSLMLPDSIAGLARFAVFAFPRATDSVAVVEMFDAPMATHGTMVTVPRGVMAEVLGGAGRVSLPVSAEVQEVNVTDDWLLLRVNGHTGWITGESAYRAVGLPEAG